MTRRQARGAPTRVPLAARCALALWIALLALPMRVSSQPQGPAPAPAAPAGLRVAGSPAADAGSDAVDRLKQLPAAVQQVRLRLGAARFGPFDLKGSCSYSAWYCLGIPCYTHGWQWSYTGYPQLRQELDQRLGAVQRVSLRFEDLFAPVQRWLVGELPAIGVEVEAMAARVDEAEPALAVAGAAGEEARRALARSIARTAERLRRGAADFQQALAGLAAFEGELGRAVQDIEGARGVMEQMLAHDERGFMDFMAGWPCGQADGLAAFEGVKKQVRTEFQHVIDAGRGYGVTAGRTGEAVSIVLGQLLNLANASRTTAEALQGAEESPAHALQALRVAVAAARWRELARYAREQLGG